MSAEDAVGADWVGDRIGPFERYENARIPFTTRLPSELVVELKRRAIRSTIQILSEHAFVLYLGSRLPPSLLGGFVWPDEGSIGPDPDYHASKPRGYTVRLPRHLLRWARVFAAEADITDQALAVKIFDWYVRTDRIPPKKEEVQRDVGGDLVITEPLLALRFRRREPAEIVQAIEILRDQWEKFEGRANIRTGPHSLPYDAPVRGRSKGSSIASASSTRRRLSGGSRET
jgi:hypothetical protein